MRRGKKMAAVMFCLGVFSTLIAISHGSVQCIGSKGEPVDWFMVYKLPRLEHSSHSATREGLGFYYMDANARYWVLSDIAINSTGHAVWYTLQQLYEKHDKQDLFYALYNDEKPSGSTTLSFGHTKGDVVFDSKTGFWLIHSVPHFPPLVADGYGYPHTGETYGQTFMCVSYEVDQLNEIGKQLYFNHPWVYDSQLPSSMEQANPDIAAVLAGKHPTDAPWSRISPLKSLAGQKFLSFAKFTKFDGDLYDELVAPYLKSPLLVESWQNGRGKSSSNCSTHFQVMNIRELSIIGVDFNETHDHSKWCVTTDLDVFQSGRLYVCIGDINRMDTQWHRAGGTVCSILPEVWLQFQSSIVRFENCSGKRKYPNAWSKNEWKKEVYREKELEKRLQEVEN